MPEIQKIACLLGQKKNRMLEQFTTIDESILNSSIEEQDHILEMSYQTLNVK